jgi:GTP-binding protein
MEIKTARFLTSNQDATKCPPPVKPEYAFIGRSNVGKSSLINMLCNHSKLAKISSTPGKTQLINHFVINDNWYLVDLPGYGYAKLSKTKREVFGKMTLEYLADRSNLVCLFILVDLRIEPQAIDLEFMKKMGEGALPFVIVFTKADKLRKGAIERNLEVYKNRLLEEWEVLPEMFVTSAEKGLGKDEILTFIDGLNNGWKMQSEF